jgi:hypothetical protein
MILQLNLGMDSIAAFALRDLIKTNKPNSVMMMPRKNGKYPGPIFAAVPIGYWVATMVKKRPMTIYMIPAPKSR